MSDPRALDHVPDPVALAALAAGCGLHGPVVPLGGGWDYLTFTCGGHVLRVPRRAECAEALMDELEVLAAVRGRLPLPVPVPRAMLARHPGVAHPCMVYPLLAGTPLADAGMPVDPRALGAALGHFLAALQALPATGEDGFAPQEWATEIDSLLAAPCRWLDDARRVAAAARLAAAPPHVDGPVVLAHCDLNAEHVLVDAAGQACGVIDWGDAGVAPWWFDFTGILLWGGEPALAAALAAFGRQPDARERAALDAHALRVALHELRWAVAEQAGGAEARKALAVLDWVLGWREG